MTSSWRNTRTFALCCALCAAGCGNYSNQDIDHELAQTALPESGDIEARLQVSVSRPDSAEYYQVMRSVVIAFNKIVVDLTGLIETVRTYPPTSRSGSQQVWGPFADENHPGWEIRVVIRRATVAANLLHVNYWVQLRQAGQDDSGWVSLLVGQYTSQSGVRAGQGEIAFNVQDARAVGYPIDSDPGLAELDHLLVSYDNSGFPVQVSMQIVKRPGQNPQQADYLYQRQEDGSGLMQFAWQGTTETGVPITATMLSRWRATGEGRSDLVANLPSLQATLGIDCWGADTVATYSYRLRDDVTQKVRNAGDPASCVY
jgi:hypothetical protein